MPEFPDVTVYVESLERRIAGATLNRIRLLSPFVLRTVDPSPADVEGKRGVTALGLSGAFVRSGLDTPETRDTIRRNAAIREHRRAA